MKRIFSKNRSARPVKWPLLLAGILLLAAALGLLFLKGARPGRFGALDESLLVQIPADQLPEGALYITQERRRYRQGELTLVIPAIGVHTPVGRSTEPEGLREMPGLYEFSQLPGEGDVNVSIAGHRDIHDMVFYDLHLLKEGDFLYLLYGGFVYQYRYRRTDVIRPDDWSVIAPQGYSALTLTTCDPIGTTLRRLTVSGALVNVEPHTAAYDFVVTDAVA